METCDFGDYHFNLAECETCPKCGYVNHRFTDEPYCDWCGKPHPGWYGAIKTLIEKR